MIERNEDAPIPRISPALKVISRSVSDNPKLDSSKVGLYFLRSRTGLVLVNKCPRDR